MICNKFGIDVFYQAFKEACGEDDQPTLDRKKFHYAIILLAKSLYSKEDNPFETMFSQMLVDQIMTADNRRKRNG
jgi:hypothetical protein